MLSIYANYPVMYLLSERESRERGRAGSKDVRTVFTLARLKIVPTIRNLYISYRMPEYVNELNSFANKTPVTFP